MKFKEDMEISITEYLQTQMRGGIKRILDVLDFTSLKGEEKKALRKIILEEMNNNYSAACRTLTCIQEKRNDKKKRK